MSEEGLNKDENMASAPVLGMPCYAGRASPGDLIRWRTRPLGAIEYQT